MVFEIIETMVHSIVLTVFGQPAYMGLFSLIVWIAILARLNAGIELSIAVMSGWIFALGVGVGFFDSTVVFGAMTVMFMSIGIMMWRLTKR